MLFKKSIREQRFRFYGVQQLNDIVYGNTRKARDAPIFISGDETITRLYTRKATDIRMRTKEKNESGVLNQNLCGSNEGYTTWKEGDPKGTGTTFCNTAYPGKLYSVGSMFRERDMGNLLQLIFSCDDYFRWKNVELVTDSHFGHFVPMVYLRLWKVFATSSFGAKSRVGIQGIETLSKVELSEEALEKEWKMLEGKRDKKDNDAFNFLDSSSSSSDEGKPGAKKVRRSRALKSKLAFFEKGLSYKSKGHYKV